MTLMLAPWSRWSWLQVAQLVVWLSSLFYLIRIQRRQDENLRTALAMLKDLADKNIRATEPNSSEVISKIRQRLRPPVGFDPTLN